MRRSESEVRLYLWAGEGIPFKRLGVTYKCSRINWLSRYNAAGMFTLTIPRAEEGSENFRAGVFVEIGRRFHGIIEEVSRSSDIQGDLLTVTGSDLLGLLGRRITVPPGAAAMMGYDTVRGTTETVIKHFVTNNCTAGKRRIPGLSVMPDKGRGIADDKYMSRHDELLKIFSEVAQAAGLGLSVKAKFDTGFLFFDVYEGQKRQPVISTERGTALEMRGLNSLLKYRNIFYATMSGAEFADEALTLAYTREGEGEPEGFERRETHMNISASHPAAGQEYAELKRLALVQATNYEPVESLTVTVNTARLTLEWDYELGDMMTVQSKTWGIEKNMRVTALETEHAGDRSAVTAHMGDERPGILARAEWRRK